MSKNPTSSHSTFPKGFSGKIAAWPLFTFVVSLGLLTALFHHLDKRTIDKQENCFTHQQQTQTQLSVQALARECGCWMDHILPLVQVPLTRLANKDIDVPAFQSQLTTLARNSPDLLFITLDAGKGHIQTLFSRNADQKPPKRQVQPSFSVGNTTDTPFLTYEASTSLQTANICIPCSLEGEAAALVLVMDLGRLIRQYILPLGSQQTGTFCLLSQNGTILSSSRPELTGHSLLGNPHANHPHTQEIIRRILNQEQGTGHCALFTSSDVPCKSTLTSWHSAVPAPGQPRLIVTLSATEILAEHLHSRAHRYLITFFILALALMSATIVYQIRTNHSIKTSWRNFMDILEFFPDAIVLVDKNKRVVQWNKAMEVLSGVNKEAVLGSSDFVTRTLGYERLCLLDALDSTDEDIRKDYYHISRQDDVITAETFIQEFHQGKGVHIWSTATWLKDHSGNILVGIECLRDITSFKEATEELKRSQDQLTLAMQATRAGLWDWDMTRNEVYLSKRWKNILGYAEDEMPSSVEAWKQAIHPDDYDRVIATNSNITQDNPSFAVEYRAQCKDGSYRWIEGRGMGVWDANDKLYRMIGSHTDISDRKQNELLFEAVLRISTTANRVRKVEYLFREIHLTLKELIGADNFFVALKDSDGSHIKYPYCVDEYEAGSSYDSMVATSKDDPCLVTWVLKHTTPICITHSDPLMKYCKGTKPKVWLGVPIVMGRDSYGVLCVQDYHNANGFGEKDLDLLVGVAEQLALALERKQNEDQITFSALHDSLTDLPNRSLFIDRLDQCLLRAKREDTFNFVVMMIDLDQFKKINEAMGHAIGDRLLIQLSQRLSLMLRSVDTLARLGGDEFFILLEGFHSPREITAIAQRILGGISQPFFIDQTTAHTSASIGIVTDAANYKNSEHILRDVDIAMYEAKKNGSGQFRIFNQQMHKQAVESMNLERDLHTTLEQKDIGIAFQPIFTTSPLRLAGFEALARWNHPHKGFIGPDVFIPIAENTGLIRELGLQMFEKACATLSHWRTHYAHDPELIMTVNVSAEQLDQDHLVENIQDILEQHAIPPHAINVELTESTFMKHPSLSLLVLNKLKKLGLHLAVDDFGTGYSSLAYLQRLPVDTLKVDRSFVKDLDTNPTSQIIAKAILNLGHSLEKKIIAEGVETQGQLDLLRDMGCEKVQGFFLSKPLSKEDAEALLEKEQNWLLLE